MAIVHATVRPGEAQAESGWRCPTLAEVYHRPLPHLGLLDRSLMRLVASYMMPHFASVSGLHHVTREADPFILALNHSTRFEALALPALLMFHRGGRKVHFFADWNFQMIPGVGLLYRRAGAIVVTRKPARPRFLNVLKPLYAHRLPSIERARLLLESGRSVGIFPEGTVNSDPDRLLRGRLGTARLSLETGAQVVPAGIRMVGGSPKRPQFELRFGEPLVARQLPAAADGRRQASAADVRGWHATIMTEIARLSGKSWEPLPQEPRHGTP